METNWKLYCKLKLPFVLGTTGFDHQALIQKTKKENVFSVIAPNMSKQIVALQSMVKSAAERFPGCFSGYSLNVTESHQKTKVDTSGTAKAMLTHFNKLCNSTVELKEVKKIRNEKEQLQLGVPEENLNGHAWHTYRLESGEGSVAFEFKHNVCGRTTYAEGVLDAVLFLNKKIESKSQEKVFDMINVLEAGSMR